MKIDWHLSYGYALPFILATIMTLGIWAVPFVNYGDVVVFFSSFDFLSFLILASVIAMSWPFQTKILHEDNADVLAVLKSSALRKVFIRASVFQAMIVLSAAIVSGVGARMQFTSSWMGALHVFANTLILAEGFSLISNGASYGKIREEITTKVHETRMRSAQTQTTNHSTE